MLRAAVKAQTELGRQVEKVMSSGGLVTDEIIIELVKARIVEKDCANGFLFDGFPRTIPQAEAMLDQDVHIDVVLEIGVPDDEIVKRLSGRRVHLDSGRVYHVVFNPPKEKGQDDVTGENLTQREDDKEDTVRNRLQIYHQQTEPLVNFYAELTQSQFKVKMVKVNGVSEVEKIKEEILSALR